MYITILVKQIYWYISQVSGERLQDHWSSGFLDVETSYLVICFYNALVICNHGPPTSGGGRGIAVEMNGALTKVLHMVC